MKIRKEQFNNLDKEGKQLIVNLIEDNYSAPDHLKPSVGELEKLDLTVFMALEPIEIIEAGYVGDDLLGVSFCKKITRTLIETRTTIIREDRRGEGIGSKMNEELEKYAIENNIKKISCYVYVDNIPSVILKLNRNYLVEGLLRDHDEPGKDEYIMSKFL